MVLLEIAQQIESTYEKIKKQRRPCWAWPLVIRPYQVKRKQDIPSFEWKWENYPLEEYNSPLPYFDNIGRVESFPRKDIHHEDAIENHWMNAKNDYGVRIMDYCRMNLYLEEKALQLNIPEKIRQHDSKELLDPLFNSKKIGERPIKNAEIDKEEADDINHQARHVIRMMKDWIKKPFLLDPIPNTVIFHAHAHPKRGRGKKVTIPTFVAQSYIRLEIVY